MIGDALKKRLRDWTMSSFGDNVEEKIAALSRTQNEYGVDPFGFSLDYALSAVAPFFWIYKHYHRVETHGIEKVPKGRVLLIPNHSGQLPMDAAMIAVAMLAEANPPRAIRSMVERWAASLPYVSTFFARVGQIIGTPENCRRLLEKEEAILVFPEGVRGISKLYHQRYQLQDFGLGFMRLALETNTPIVPIAVVGAEEQAPAFNVRFMARLVGAPAFPVMPFPPFFPLLPLPVRYHIYFGEPCLFTGHPDDDDEQIEQLVKHVRLSIESMLRLGLKNRRSVFL